MIRVDQEVDRFLSLLRDKIRDREFTQMQVQERLGWGTSYISQLFTRQKALRLEQVLLILRVIGVEPREFFLELYVMRSPPRVSKQPPIVKSEEERYGYTGVRALASADPHAGWCGGGGLDTPGYPILRSSETGYLPQSD